MSKPKYVVVTTDSTRRGVFFGELVSRDGDELTLRNAQNCLRWSAETGGVFGLATRGPQPGSRVGPPVPELTINGITSISVATEVAIAAWQAQPW